MTQSDLVKIMARSVLQQAFIEGNQNKLEEAQRLDGFAAVCEAREIVRSDNA